MCQDFPPLSLVYFIRLSSSVRESFNRTVHPIIAVTNNFDETSLSHYHHEPLGGFFSAKSLWKYLALPTKWISMKYRECLRPVTAHIRVWEKVLQTSLKKL